MSAIKNDDGSTLDENENQLSKLKMKIDKLGAINLAAIDELKEHEDRKTYLDKQYDDLTKSVDTLESAIKKLILKQKLNSKRPLIQ